MLNIITLRFHYRNLSPVYLLRIGHTGIYSPRPRSTSERHPVLVAKWSPEFNSQEACVGFPHKLQYFSVRFSLTLYGDALNECVA